MYNTNLSYKIKKKKKKKNILYIIYTEFLKLNLTFVQLLSCLCRLKIKFMNKTFMQNFEACDKKLTLRNKIINKHTFQLLFLFKFEC